MAMACEEEAMAVEGEVAPWDQWGEGTEGVEEDLEWAEEG